MPSTNWLGFAGLKIRPLTHLSSMGRGEGCLGIIVAEFVWVDGLRIDFGSLSATVGFMGVGRGEGDKMPLDGSGA